MTDGERMVCLEEWTRAGDDVRLAKAHPEFFDLATNLLWVGIVAAELVEEVIAYALPDPDADEPRETLRKWIYRTGDGRPPQ